MFNIQYSTSAGTKLLNMYTEDFINDTCYIYCRTLMTFLFPLFGRVGVAAPSPKAGAFIPALTVSMSKFAS